MIFGYYNSNSGPNEGDGNRGRDGLGERGSLRKTAPAGTAGLGGAAEDGGPGGISNDHKSASCASQIS